MSYRNAPLEMLQVGAVLQCPIRDAEGKLLLGPGVVVTQDFLVALFKRGVRSVAVDVRDWTRLNAFTSHGRVRTALPDRKGAQTNWNAAATRD
ncbi:MAG: hypothetical protein KDA41_21670, partial [Planctomycetales bacterium]|nr:hypothetical protein [Planctomycetales bacterium]